MATAKKPTKSKTTVTQFIKSNPNMKPAEVAKHLGVSIAYVYVTRSKLKQLSKKSDKAEGLNIDVVHKKENSLALRSAREIVADMVNHPPHYKVGGIETIDFIEAKQLGYNLGNVVKYITRADHKDSRKENLEKARWYLERELSRC